MRIGLWLTFVLWAAVIGTASAQAPITVTISEFPGREDSEFSLPDLASPAAHPILLSECETMISFRFTNIDTTRTQLVFYRGSMCNDPEVRNDTSTTTCDPLPSTDLTTTTEMRSQVDVMIRAGDLAIACDATESPTGSGIEDIWVLAVTSTSATDAVTGAGQQVQFDIAYDFSPPGGPAGLTAGGGENTVTLSWTAPSESVETYQVFLDPTGCPSTLLADPANPDPSALFAEFMGPASNFTLMWPDSVPIGGVAAVGIRAIDSSGNPGPLSDVVCVERVEVTSWRDRFCMENPTECESGGGCSAAPTPASPIPFVVMLAVLGLAWRFRR